MKRRRGDDNIENSIVNDNYDQKHDHDNIISMPKSRRSSSSSHTRTSMSSNCRSDQEEKKTVPIPHNAMLNHCSVSLSPQYNTYTPMLIGDIHRLELIDGIDCIVSPPCHALKLNSGSTSQPMDQPICDTDDTNSNYVMQNENHAHVLTTHHPSDRYILPISKCDIRGIVVAVAKSGRGSTLSCRYVIDDGSGLIDCVSWENDEIHGYYRWYQQKHAHLNSYDCDALIMPPSHLRAEVGETVRVLGKLKILRVGDYDESSSMEVNGIYRKRSSCVRQLTIMTIENCSHPKNLIDATNEEVLHWLKCIHFGRRMLLRHNSREFNNSDDRKDINNLSQFGFSKDYTNSSLSDQFHHNSKKEKNGHGKFTACYLQMSKDTDYSDDDITKRGREYLGEHIPNNITILKYLDSDIISQVYQYDLKNRPNYKGRDNINRKEAEYDTSWAVFGFNCDCHHLSYKLSLLYCHCIATKEVLDPDLIFRDALLKKLLDMEKNYVINIGKNQKQQQNPTSYHEGSDDASISQYLTFTFEAMQNDQNLLEIANNVIPETSHKKQNITRLFINTFRSLRKDGILYHLNERDDVYMLVSKNYVMEPYLKSLFKYTENNLEEEYAKAIHPRFISQVTHEKMRYLMKSIKRKR